MALIPEIIFQTTISRGIHTLRTDSRFLDQLFRNETRSTQEQMRLFITQNQIDLSINFPRSQLSVPAIVILLKSDNEHTQGAYLDDFMGIGTPDEFSYDGDLAEEVLGGTASTTSMSGPGLIVFGPWRVLSATLNTLSVTNRTFFSQQFVDGVEPLTVHIVAGTGAGQQREIVANSTSNLMVDENWTTVPDTTSVFEVRNPVKEVLGEPAKLYDCRDTSTVLERKGGLYTNKYQCQVVGANPEQAIYLYNILKSIFTLSRIFMERQGIINFRMNGTDFVNPPDYLPDFAYMRRMDIEFESPFEVFAQVENLVESFSLCLIDGVDGVDAQISVDPVAIGPTEPEIGGP